MPSQPQALTAFSSMVLFSSSTVMCICLSGGVKGEHFTFHEQFFPALDFECSRISNFRIALLLFLFSWFQATPLSSCALCFLAAALSWWCCEVTLGVGGAEAVTVVAEAVPEPERAEDEVRTDLKWIKKENNVESLKLSNPQKITLQSQQQKNEQETRRTKGLISDYASPQKPGNRRFPKSTY